MAKAIIINHGNCEKCDADGDAHITRSAAGVALCYQCRTGKLLPVIPERVIPRLPAARVAELVDALYGPAR